MDNTGREIIISEPKGLSRRETALALWQPKRAVPVVGAAAVIWLGKRAIRAVLSRTKSPEIPTIRIQKRDLEPKASPEQRKSGYRVTYRAYAEWIITEDE